MSRSSIKDAGVSGCTAWPGPASHRGRCDFYIGNIMQQDVEDVETYFNYKLINAFIAYNAGK